MGDLAVACARRARGSSRARTQGAACAGGTGKPEDEEPAQIIRDIRVREIARSPIQAEPADLGDQLALQPQRDQREDAQEQDDLGHGLAGGARPAPGGQA